MVRNKPSRILAALWLGVVTDGQPKNTVKIGRRVFELKGSALLVPWCDMVKWMYMGSSGVYQTLRVTRRVAVYDVLLSAQEKN